MDQGQFVSKSLLVFCNSSDVKFVSVHGVKLYSYDFDIKDVRVPSNVGYSSYETIKISDKIRVEWTCVDRERKTQIIDRPESVPKEIDVACNLIVYFYDNQWRIKYLPGDEIYTFKDLVRLVPTWHNISE